MPPALLLYYYTIIWAPLAQSGWGLRGAVKTSYPSCISSFPSFYSRIRVDRTGWGWFVLVTSCSLIASGYRLLPDTKETFDLFYFRSISRTDTSQNPDFLVFSITDITVVGSLKGLSYLGSFFLYKPIRHLALLKTYDICGHSLPLLSATYPQGRSPVDEWW